MDSVFKRLGIDAASVNYSVHIVTPDEIRALNLQHRNKDRVTDVLSFPFLHIKPGQLPTRDNFPFDVNPETGRVELGDIVINEDEPDKDTLTEHGLMHLLGYHHDDDKDDLEEQ